MSITKFSVYKTKILLFKSIFVDRYISVYLYSTIANMVFNFSQGCRGFFGSDSSKSTKFGPDVAHTILFLFLVGAKVGTPRGRLIGEIQYGRDRS
jgi:hypothetical protein